MDGGRGWSLPPRRETRDAPSPEPRKPYCHGSSRRRIRVNTIEPELEGSFLRDSLNQAGGCWVKAVDPDFSAMVAAVVKNQGYRLRTVSCCRPDDREVLSQCQYCCRVDVLMGEGRVSLPEAESTSMSLSDHQSGLASSPRSKPDSTMSSPLPL